MNTKLQHLVFGLVTLLGVAAYIYFSTPSMQDTDTVGGNQFRAVDSGYIRETKQDNGASGVVSKAPPLRHPYNRTKYDNAMARQERRDFVGAEKLYRDILSQTPDEFLARHGLGTVLFYQGRYEEAKRAYEEEIESAPDYHSAHVGLGAVAKEQGRYEEAVMEYTRAISGDPTIALAYKGRGQSLFHMGRYSQAKTDFEMVLALLPDGVPLAIEAREYLHRIGDQTSEGILKVPERSALDARQWKE